MNSETVSVTIKQSKEKVFSYIANIENMPEWAVEFCQKVTKDNGSYKIHTTDGELYCDVKADYATGVIDFYSGPAKEETAYYPTRVVELENGSTAYFFTMIPEVCGLGDEDIFKQQVASLKKEFAVLKRNLENK